MPVIKLTKAAIDSIPFTKQGQALYFDSEMKGLGLCVGKKTKTYFVQGAVNRRSIRHTIGRHGIFTPDEARKEARIYLADMARGIDPFQKQEKSRADQLTVVEALEEYIRDRKGLSAITIDGYRAHLRLYVPDWANRPLTSINKADIFDRHRKIGETRGPVVANKTMRVMRQLFNYSHAKHNNIPDNPARYLTLVKGWYKVERRRTYIKPADLAAWYQGVQMVVNPSIRDFLLLLLFTGLRKSEAIRLRWDMVDMTDRTFTIPKTKNGDPHVLPMSNWLYEFFRRRKEACGSSPWVFPGHGDNGHMTEPKKMVAFVIRHTGVNFCLHDLRRTFITLAESLDIAHYSLKRLLNHRSDDVTSGYIVVDVNRLREPMDKISKRIEELIQPDKPL